MHARLLGLPLTVVLGAVGAWLLLDAPMPGTRCSPVPAAVFASAQAAYHAVAARGHIEPGFTHTTSHQAFAINVFAPTGAAGAARTLGTLGLPVVRAEHPGFAYRDPKNRLLETRPTVADVLLSGTTADGLRVAALILVRLTEDGFEPCTGFTDPNNPWRDTCRVDAPFGAAWASPARATGKYSILIRRAGATAAARTARAPSRCAWSHWPPPSERMANTTESSSRCATRHSRTQSGAAGTITFQRATASPSPTCGSRPWLQSPVITTRHSCGRGTASPPTDGALEHCVDASISPLHAADHGVELIE